MFKTTLLSALTLFLTVQCFSTANFVYHERTTNIVGGACGPYVDNLTPTSADAVTIAFGIAYLNSTNRARIYYTTDGTIPSGDHGIGNGTTQVLTAVYFCTYIEIISGNTVEVVKATIPAQLAGVTVNYIVGAWHTGGGNTEIFGNNNAPGTGLEFSYTVLAPLPLHLIDFSGKKINDNVQLSWITEQELNVDHYEIYRSSNGIQFQSIGTKKAANSTFTNSYIFNDANTFKGNNFYKIKSVDRDGKLSFTNVIKLSFDNRSLVHLYVSGNMLHITLSSPSKEKYSLRLVNNLGQVLHVYTILHDGMNTSYNVNLPPGLSRNIYHVVVDAEGWKYSQSIVN